MPPRPSPITVERALEVCVRSFAIVRSITHPSLVERVGCLWRQHDAPRRSGDARGEEWWATGVPPEEIDATAREHADGRFALCVVLPSSESETPLRDGFRALGYRLIGTEPLMVRSLERISRASAAIQVERVIDEATARQLAKAARSRQLLPEHLEPEAPLRRYVVRDGDEIVAWVGSVSMGDESYCDNMYVREDHRRRGIATAMLNRMLRDDRALGATSALLLASHMGALLYPTLGYEQVGTLFIYRPPAR